MGIFHLIVTLATMTLVSSLPSHPEVSQMQENHPPTLVSGLSRVSEASSGKQNHPTRRHGEFPKPQKVLPQKVSEYFPDFRYPDQMVNPEFMTAKCTSEGVFPHPYSCTWYYRCHDRIGGGGFFHTSYFICEPGTVFDDDLDQCVSESSITCDGEDVSCMIQKSSCRSCQVGHYQQELCEFKECYSGGRPTGIHQLCDKGQMHDGQNCVKVIDCPRANITHKECPLNKLRPLEKWTDHDSGCSVIGGCRADKFYQESLCSSFYDCENGARVRKTCPDGYLFSKQWRLCIIPPKDCSTTTPDICTLDNSSGGVSCWERTGCLEGTTIEITQTLCDHYTCDHITFVRCEGRNQFYNPDRKTCQLGLSECPPECVPNKGIAVQASCWEHRGCQREVQTTQTLCNYYTCEHSSSQQFSCDGIDQFFNPATKTCESKLPGCPICNPNEGIPYQDSCTEHDVCIDGIKGTQSLCNHYTCSYSGYQKFSCEGKDTFFNPDTRKCQKKPESTCGTATGDCSIITSTCETFEVCYPERRNQTLCTECFDQRTKTRGDICYEEPWKLWDTTTESCTDKPSKYQLCEQTQYDGRSEQLPLSTFPARSSMIVEKICPIIESSCKSYNVCEPNEHIQTLCTECVADNFGELTDAKICWKEPGKVWDTTTKQCTEKPSSTELCEGRALTPVVQ